MLDAVVDQPIPRRGLADETTVLRALLERSETGLIALDGAFRVVVLNAAARKLLGIPADVGEGSSLPAAAKRGTALPPGKLADLTLWLHGDLAMPLSLPIGAESKLLIAATPGVDGHLLLSLKRASPATAPADRRDPLTGLSDRAWFKDRFAAALQEPGGKPALLLIDLDRFKAVNDSLGHPVGDALLQLVAKRLTGALRNADVISRLSGDEFAIVMKRPRDPEAVGRRLVALLSRPYQIEGTTVSIGASVGIALAPDHGTDPVAMIGAADVALYAAKNSGRGNARLFDAELEQRTRERHQIAEALREAIPLKQFDLHFQPQMVLETGELSGFEAFLRWQHPVLGALLPLSFLPVAETTGLIWPIGEWVLQRACEEAMRWPSSLSVSVNVSARQLTDRHRLPRLIKSVLLRTGLAPHRLEIEVQESALTAHPETETVLRAVVALGVRVSLDDFGTGYSSLSHLRQFPLHKLKIDGSFVLALGTSEEATNVVRAVAALGRTLGVVTIAENVETAEQQDQVQQDGCNSIQGYLLSYPVPAAEVAGVIATMSTSEAA